MQQDRYDVAVLGSGLIGTILATILAKAGRRVALIERGSHPRLAIGESLVPNSAMWFWYLGHKHDIPELRSLAHFDSLSRSVGPSSGIKRGVAYAYHREGQQAIRPEESAFFIGPKQPIFRESQLYRADVDLSMVEAARRYGVHYRDRTTVTDVSFTTDAVTLTIDDGSSLAARYVVDASGRNSVLAEAYGLREEPCRLRHHSRSVFAHVTGVRPLEEIAPNAEGRSVSASWSKVTLHHVFEGGWFWVIPFNNHGDAPNNLVSVGLTVDPRIHPRQDELSPEKEFQRFVSRFPVVERHLGRAEPETSFIATDRLQYSSSTSVGDRFLLLQHAYGFVDPLFSRGIWRSLEAVDAVADQLQAALDDDDLSAERFAGIDAMQASMLDNTDQMVRNAYRSTADYDLWTAWTRVWFADEFLTTIPMLAATFRCVTEGDQAAFGRLDGDPRPGTNFSFSADLQALVDDAEQAIDAVESGRLTAEEARRRICRQLEQAPYLPHNLFDYADPHRFGMDLTPANLARLVWWGRRHAPASVRAEMFDFSVARLGRLQLLDAVRPGLVKRDRLGNVVAQVR
jgi:FADH2 O2-dependent halogenase